MAGTVGMAANGNPGPYRFLGIQAHETVLSISTSPLVLVVVVTKDLD